MIVMNVQLWKNTEILDKWNLYYIQETSSTAAFFVQLMGGIATIFRIN